MRFKFKTETIVGLFVFAALVVFAAIAYQLGSLRLDLARYAAYTVRFADASGLVVKSDVKISGVRVGWVESIHLVSRDMTVHVTFKIPKDYPLYRDAKATLRQEGLLGSKYLEIVPGTTGTSSIPPGGSLLLQPDTSIQMDEVYDTFRTIAKRIDSLSVSLQETAADVRSLIQTVNEHLGGEDVGTTIKTVKEVVSQAGETFAKVKQREGSLGKLLADDTLYHDIKTTSDYARSCLDRIKGCSITFDSHLEVLPHHHTNVKWYFDTHLSPCSPVFGLIGVAYSRDGFARRFRARLNNHIICGAKERSDSLRLNLQVGGSLGRFSLRVGLIEGTAGVGVDFWLARDCFKWLSTFEAYDFKGRNRFERDCKAHLKWLNRFFINSWYISVGADDFISRCNRSAFVGVGALFSTSDFFCGGC